MNHPLAPLRLLFRPILLSACFLSLIGLGWAQLPGRTGDPAIDIGILQPGDRKKYTIAIPNFQPIPGSQELAPGALNAILYNDLELDGSFRRPANPALVEETAARDRRTGDVNFAEWRALNVEFVVHGEYRAEANALIGNCLLYDTATGQRIFGRQYTNYGRAEIRELAHQMADDIVFWIAGVRGVASTKIVYVSRRGKHSEIYVCDADGSNHRPLTSDRSIVAAPCWGVNGTEIYFTTYKDYNPDLAGIFLDGSRSWFISRHAGMNVSPSYNEQNQRIALSMAKDGNSEIYTMDRLGKELRRLTSNKAIDVSPSWSPNGRQIVFTSDRTGSEQIWAMDSDGGNQRRLTRDGARSDSPAWSPTGERIAYVARTPDARWNLFTMNVDGSDRWQLTQGQGNNEDPSWAPNGEHIIFSSNRTGTYQIYRMRADGGEAHRLTTEGVNISPDWSPWFN